MTDEAGRLAQERLDDIKQAEFDRGKAAARVDARLDRMDDRIDGTVARLDGINGSVRETGRSLNSLKADMGEKLDGLSSQLEKIVTEQQTRDKVNEALVKAQKETAEKAEKAEKAAGTTRLSKWQIRGVIGGLVLAALAVLVPLVIGTLTLLEHAAG